jgi:hypothetical protein
MSMSKIALAIPLSLGIACSTSGTQSRSDHTGAMWTDGHRDAATQAYTEGTGSSGSQDAATPQGSGASASDTGSSGASGSSGSMGSSGSSDSSSAAGSAGSAGSSDQGSGGAMGSGGSSETMGSSGAGSADQGTAGSSDQAQQGASAGAGNTGAHEGDQHVMGKVSKVSKDEISIKSRSGAAKTLKINPDTAVSINGKDAKPTQLKQGQMVRASYENVGGDDVAVKIEVGKGMRHGRMKHHGGSMPMGGSGGADTGGSH